MDKIHEAQEVHNRSCSIFSATLAVIWFSRSHAKKEVAEGEAIFMRYIEEQTPDHAEHDFKPGEETYVNLLNKIAMGEAPGFFRAPCRYACTDQEKEAVLAFIMREPDRQFFLSSSNESPRISKRHERHGSYSPFSKGRCG